MTLAASTAGAVRVAPYDDALEEAHARFALRMWPTKRRRREPVYTRWKFRGPERGEVPGLLLAVLDGEVVGQTGLLPVDVAIDDARARGQWVCDLMVDAALRGHGVAARLYESAMARGMVTLGSNASPSAVVSMQRAGFRMLTGPQIAVLPLEASHVLSWKVPAPLRALVPLASAAARPFLRRRAERLIRNGERAGRVERVTWKEVAPLVAARQARMATPRIVHDEDFLRWRCSGLAGYVEPLTALRANDGSYAIVGTGAPYFYLFEWGAESDAGFAAVFGAAIRLALEVGALTMETLAEEEVQAVRLRRLGFLLLRRPVSILWHSVAHAPPVDARMAYSLFDSDGNL